MSSEGATALYAGQLAKDRELTSRAVEVASQGDRKGRLGRRVVNLAIAEALLGNTREAEKQAARAMGFSVEREVQSLVALALVSPERRLKMCGDLNSRPAHAFS